MSAVFFRNEDHHASFVVDTRSTWMIPGTYDAAADEPTPCCCGKGLRTPTGKPHYCTTHGRWSDAAPPPQTITTLLGYPFDLKNGEVQLNGSYTATELRQIFEAMRSDYVRQARHAFTYGVHVPKSYIEHGYSGMPWTRLPYDEARKRRPEGVCDCNFTDRECYARGHWEAK